MFDDKEMAKSEMSTAESVFRGAAEAPSGAGARAAGDGGGHAPRPRASLVFLAVGCIAGPDAMNASVPLALWKDAIKEDLWKIALGNPTLLDLLRELDGVLEVR